MGLIIGILAVCLLPVAAFFGFKAYQRFGGRKSTEDAFNLVQDTLPPIHVELTPIASPKWEQAEALAADQSLLAVSGFEHSGEFETFMGSARTLVSLWGNAKKGLICAIKETSPMPEGDDEYPVARYTADIFIVFADDTTLTLTNNPLVNGLPRAAAHRLVALASSDLKGLFKAIKPNLPAAIKIQPQSDVVFSFKSFMTENNTWLWEEAQLRSAEMADFFKPLGVVMKNELVEQLLSFARDERSYVLRESVLHKLAATSQLPAVKWDAIKGRLVVVHKDMNPDDLVGCFHELFETMAKGDEDTIDALAERDLLDCAVTTFGDTLANMESGARIKRVAILQKPVLTHVYLAE